MNSVDHVEAALARLNPEDIGALAPARRERLRETLGCYVFICDRFALIAKRAKERKAGILPQLKRGDRAP